MIVSSRANDAMQRYASQQQRASSPRETRTTHYASAAIVQGLHSQQQHHQQQLQHTSTTMTTNAARSRLLCLGVAVIFILRLQEQRFLSSDSAKLLSQAFPLAHREMVPCMSMRALGMGGGGGGWGACSIGTMRGQESLLVEASTLPRAHNGMWGELGLLSPSTDYQNKHKQQG